MAFGFDLTRFVRPGPEENVIAVRTDNAWDYKEFVSGQGFQWADQNFNANYGGLVKNVNLHMTGILHQTLLLYSSLGYTGVYVYPSDIDLENNTAVVNVESEVVFEPRRDQPFEFEVEIRDRDGKTVSVFPGGEARDAFGEITELVDQGNARTGEEDVGESELSIIEIEFYEDLPVTI